MIDHNGEEYTYSHRCIDPHAILDLPEAQKWTRCSDKNPDIDMSYPHEEEYLVWYEHDGYDVAKYSNANVFDPELITEPYWWATQYCKVIAWMPLPKPYEEQGV